MRAAIERVLITQKYELKFAVDPAFMSKLERVRSMLSGKYHKKMNFEELFGLMMDEYLERHGPEGRIDRRGKRERAGNPRQREQTDKLRRPARSGSDRQNRHIPQSIRDEVFARDGGRCTFVGADGVRCDSTWDLEIDHIIPYARGGTHDSRNLRLLCARHNLLHAEEEFGPGFMDRYRRRE